MLKRMKMPEVRVEVAGDKFSYQTRTGYTYIRAMLKNNAVKSFERSLKDSIIHRSGDVFPATLPHCILSTV